MSTDSPDRGEGFLSRWSRVKTKARDEVSREATAPAASAETAAAPPVTSSTDSEPPPLPPVDELTLESDFRGFFHPKVDEDVRRAALRKLFSDPHFNVMDGLDTYIDDYSKTEPIPAAMLASMKQAQRIFEWAAEDEEARRVAAAAPSSQDAVEIPAPQIVSQNAEQVAIPQAVSEALHPEKM